MTARRGILIGSGVLAALAALAVTLALLLGGGNDGASAGGDPVPAPTEAPAQAPGGLPADLQACLEEQGVDTSSGIPHGPQLHPALQACGQYLPGGEVPDGSPGAR